MYDKSIPTEKREKIGEGMVAKTFVSKCELLELQWLFASIRSCAGAGTELQDGKPLKDRDKESFENLKKFLKTVIKGIENEQGKYEHLKTLKEGVEAERAFGSIRPVLPEDLTSAKKKIQDIVKICDNILKHGNCPDIQQKELIAFCRLVLNYTDQKRLG